MIVILSKANYEISTDKLCKVLSYYNANYIRINGQDFLKSGSVYYNLGSNFLFQGKHINEKEVTVVFDRRWYDQDELDIKELEVLYNKIDYLKIIEERRKEFFVLSDFFVNCFVEAEWIPRKKHVNKLQVLLKAKDLGFKIPNTYVISNKVDLFKCLQDNGSIITKAIGDINFIRTKNKLLSSLTKKISIEDFDSITEVFSPSLVQEEIIKDYEIRIFYFFESIYAMAILSQKDEKTKVDFRDYNHSKMSRMIPYKLHSNIEEKIVLLMKELNLNTGSIDLMFSNGQYYFLEVNPVGQFDMVEVPCGFGIYEHIAQKLINLDTKR